MLLGEVGWTAPGLYGTASEQQCTFWEENSFLVFDCVQLPGSQQNSLSYTDFQPHTMQFTAE